MAKVIILCGKIASGKTTYAQKLRREQHAIILSCDDLMLTLFDGCLREKHDDTVRRIHAYFCHLAENIIESGIDAVLDFGYWKESERTAVRSYFDTRHIKTELHYLTVEESLRLARLNKRNEQLRTSEKREYIIEEELRTQLDNKFEEPKQFDYIIEEG